MTRMRICIAVLLAAALAACAISPAVRYYTLEAVVASAAAPTQQTATLGVGEVRMPAYLDRLPVVQRNGAVLAFNDAERWAEPLADAVPRVLAADLAAQLPDHRIVQQPWPRTGQPDHKLTVHVERFEAVGNSVELQVNWSVQDREGALLLSRHQQWSQPCESASTADVVKAHSAAIAAFSAAVAAEVRREKGVRDN